MVSVVNPRVFLKAMYLFAKCQSNPKVAKELGVHRGTVERYRNRIRHMPDTEFEIMLRRVAHEI